MTNKEIPISEFSFKLKASHLLLPLIFLQGLLVFAFIALWRQGSLEGMITECPRLMVEHSLRSA